MTPEEQAEAAEICAQQGHDDRVLARTQRAYPMVECQRCGRIGWRVPE